MLDLNNTLILHDNFLFSVLLLDWCAVVLLFYICENVCLCTASVT